MSGRKSDAARAARASERRHKQHGETEENYRRRVAASLEQSSGLARVTITACFAVHTGGLRYLVCGFNAVDERPVLKCNRGTVAAAARAFERLANDVRGSIIKAARP